MSIFSTDFAISKPEAQIGEQIDPLLNSIDPDSGREVWLRVGMGELKN